MSTSFRAKDASPAPFQHWFRLAIIRLPNSGCSSNPRGMSNFEQFSNWHPPKCFQTPQQILALIYFPGSFILSKSVQCEKEFMVFHKLDSGCVRRTSIPWIAATRVNASSKCWKSHINLMNSSTCQRCLGGEGCGEDCSLSQRKSGWMAVNCTLVKLVGNAWWNLRIKGSWTIFS